MNSFYIVRIATYFNLIIKFSMEDSSVAVLVETLYEKYDNVIIILLRNLLDKD